MIDVFISYNRMDVERADALRERLTDAGLSSFIDHRDLRLGRPWTPALEEAISERCHGVLVLLGRHGTGPWQDEEINLALQRQISDGSFPVIPVLLPGYQQDRAPASFLTMRTWAEFHDDPSDRTAIDAILAGLQGEPPGRAAHGEFALCPYRGLEFFREQDARLFFGREEKIDQLYQHVLREPVTAVVGRSGAGKSSLVHAGLVPKLRQHGCEAGTPQRYEIIKLRPGRAPLETLYEILSPASFEASEGERIVNAKKGADFFRSGDLTVAELLDRVLEDDAAARNRTAILLVDQWEELYTLSDPATADDGTTKDDEESEDADKQPRVAKHDVARFIDLLLAATRRGRAKLVFTVRADFYGDLLAHDPLGRAIEGKQIHVGPIPDLRRVIEAPARYAGLDIDPPVVEHLIEGVANDEGRLPLLSFCLQAMWQRRGPQSHLTLDTLEAVGGLAGAIGERARALYAELSEEVRAEARRIFVSLVTPGEGHRDSRAPLSLAEDAAQAEVVRAFSHPTARLLVTGWDETGKTRRVEVSHEALLAAWDELKGWVDTNRDALRRFNAIRRKKQDWERKGEDTSLLLPPGLPIEEGRTLLDEHGDVLVRRGGRVHSSLAFGGSNQAATSMVRCGSDWRPAGGTRGIR